MPDKPLLTPMQRLILSDRATGRTCREIADARFLSVRTVHFHCNEAFARLGVHNIVAAINEARRLRLID